VIEMAIENPQQPGRTIIPSDDISDSRIQRLLIDSMNAALLPHKFRLLNIEAQHRLAQYHSHYNPNQPRVPAGHPDGGQWTTTGYGAVRVAANEKFPSGPNIFSIILGEAAARAIERYRKSNILTDLFGTRLGTVTWTRFKGQDVFGSNSTSPTYTSTDYAAAERMRDTLLTKYPELRKSDNSGQMPFDAVFHAEATILLRAARENGGTLAGQTLEIVSDRVVCNNCEKILPKIGLELGNPTVRFVDKTRRKLIMRDGDWLP
jgi:hypothetical protein